MRGCFKETYRGTKCYFFLFEDTHFLLQLGDTSVLVLDDGLHGVDPGSVGLLHGCDAFLEGIDPFVVIFLHEI